MPAARTTATAAAADSAPGHPVTGLSTPALESELLGMAGHIAAAQCRFLQLLAEFDRRGGWAGPGLKSCAHWLCWRIGMSLRTASEHVRVAHALAELPAIADAFAAGRISYSKVRAITRLAGRSSAGSAQAPGSGEAGSGACAEGASAVGDEPASGAAATPPGSPAPLAEDAEQSLLALALTGTASHVEAVVRATRRRQAGPRHVAALRSLSWQSAEDGSLVLRGRFTPDEGALLVAAIEALVPPRPATRYDDAAPPADWRERADEQAPGTVTDRVGARRADALIALVTGTADTGSADTGPARSGSGDAVLRGRAQVIVHIEAGTGGARIGGGPEIAADTAERLACDAAAQVLLNDTRRNRLYLGRSRRLASPAQIAALTVIDDGRCRFPGCDQTRYLHAHHVRHWLHGGRTDVDNLVLLCSHHHVLVHDRGYRIDAAHGEPIAGRWRFSRPDGTPVPTSGLPLRGNTESLVEIHARADVRIAHNGLTPTWAGERLDPAPLVDRLLPAVDTAAA